MVGAEMREGAAASECSTSMRLGRAAFRGWFDPREIPHGDTTVENVGDGSVRISGPCFGIALNPASVRWHAGRRQVAIWMGRPSVDGDLITNSEESVGRLVAAIRDVDHNEGSTVRGHFCIIYLDLEAARVTLMTDRMGVFPLCYSQESVPRLQKFLFSDRADSVDSEAGRQLDEQAILDYVYFHVIPAPRTVFRGVRRLTPASRLVFKDARVELKETWTPRFTGEESSAHARLQARFREIVERSVAEQITCDRFGTFLSGGTDSSTVAGMACRITKRAVPTFSIGFDQAGYDELEYARIAARHFGTEHHEFYVSADDLVENIPGVAAHYDQPFGNSSALPAFYCALRAREFGVSKLLAGDGGDELFGGNARYGKQKVFDYYWRIPTKLRKVAIEPIVLGIATLDRLPVLRKAKSYVQQARVPMPQRTETYNLLTRFGAENVFTPRFVQDVDVLEPGRLQADVYGAIESDSLVERMLAYDWRFTLADNDLPKVTRTCQLAGMDVGFPLLTDDLIDFSLQLSPELKVRGTTLRYFFKQALADFLPPQILRKKKHGFGLPFGYWVGQHASLSLIARRSVQNLVDRRIVKHTLVDDLFSRRLTEHPGFYGEMIWILMMLEQWLAAHCGSFVAE